MPLTDSMEKPPTAGRASGSIAFFSNSYARLPEHFFTRLAPTPGPKPRLIKFNDSLASDLGVNTALSRHAFYLVNPAAPSKIARRKIKQLEASTWEQIPPKTAYSWRV